jgi:ribosomal protein L16 Arg81 hydroxylase
VTRIDLEALLGEMPTSKFVGEYFHRLPFALAGAANSLIPLGSWEVLGEIIGSEGLDLLVVRDGQQLAGPDPTSLKMAQKLSAEGYTLVVRHAERHHAGIRSLAAAIEEDFAAPVNVHLYATPAGGRGFSWHYDAEDVFIVQASGRKEYSLRKNTVHPWPLVETIPADMRYPSEIMPLMRVVLAAGDWLYIPCGYWHKADAAESPETAISLAIGVMSPAAIEVYDFLRTRLVDSLLWRQRLPVAGKAATLSEAEMKSHYRQLFGQLAADLGRALEDEALLESFLGGQARTQNKARCQE